MLKATCFFRSFSIIPLIEESLMLKALKSLRILNLPALKKASLFMIRKSPAVTRVLLCTKALIGVGAAIALGNHPIKGYWALLVKATNLIITSNNEVLIPLADLKSSPMRRRASPNRLLMRVNILLLELS